MKSILVSFLLLAGCGEKPSMVAFEVFDSEDGHYFQYTNGEISELKHDKKWYEWRKQVGLK